MTTMQRDYRVSQADLARELDCARSTICRLVQRGMPVTPDGRLWRRATLRWMTQNVIGSLGGWYGTGSIAGRAAQLLRGDRGRRGRP